MFFYKNICFGNNLFMKKINKEKMYIFFIVLLSVLFVGLFILTTTGLFYKGANKKDSAFKVGQTFVVETEKTGSEVLSFEFDGSFLSGEFLKQNISIKNNSEKDFFVRAKVFLFTEKNDDPVILLETDENWEKIGKEYVFTGKLLSFNTVGLCKGLSLDENKQLASSKKYILTVCVETLSAEFDRQAIWGY